jgi:hypothetical protein
MNYLSFFGKVFGSRVFLMFGIFLVFIFIAIENVMGTATVHIVESETESIFKVIPVSILLLLASAFLIVVKRRWADCPAVGLLFLALILHRPLYWLEPIVGRLSLTEKIAAVPFNYFFYAACAALIIYLVVQIRNNKYKISLK